MRYLKIITASIAIGSLLSLAACKKDEKKADDKGDKGDDKGDDKGATKTTDTDKANPCAGGKMSLDAKKDMANKMVGMMGDVATAITAGAEDCAKMTEGLNGVADKHKDFIAKMKEMMAKGEEKDPAFDKWFEETHGETMKNTLGPAMVGAAKCQTDEAFKAAMAKVMPSN